jgi:hypothetical protein
MRSVNFARLATEIVGRVSYQMWTATRRRGACGRQIKERISDWLRLAAWTERQTVQQAVEAGFAPGDQQQWFSSSSNLNHQFAGSHVRDDDSSAELGLLDCPSRGNRVSNIIKAVVCHAINADFEGAFDQSRPAA